MKYIFCTDFVYFWTQVSDTTTKEFYKFCYTFGLYTHVKYPSFIQWIILLPLYTLHNQLTGHF